MPKQQLAALLLLATGLDLATPGCCGEAPDTTPPPLALVSVWTNDERYWAGRTKVADMGLCVLYAKIANLEMRLKHIAHDIVVITDPESAGVIRGPLELIGAKMVVSNVTSLYTKDRVECCEEDWMWNLLKPTMLKIEAFGLVQYERVIFLDLDVFLDDDIPVDGAFASKSAELVASGGGNTPMGAGMLFVRPTQEAYSLMMRLFRDGFTRARGWGKRGWLVGGPGEKAWEGVDCLALPHYCRNKTTGRPPRRDYWSYFGVEGDQGLIYATYLSAGGRESYEPFTYKEMQIEFPSTHYYGTGKPWDQMKASAEVNPSDYCSSNGTTVIVKDGLGHGVDQLVHVTRNHYQFWITWRMASKIIAEALPHTKCAAVLTNASKIYFETCSGRWIGPTDRPQDSTSVDRPQDPTSVDRPQDTLPKTTWTGCERRMSTICPDWKSAVPSCKVCAKAHIKKLEPHCTLAKAIKKCEVHTQGPEIDRRTGVRLARAGPRDESARQVELIWLDRGEAVVLAGVGLAAAYRLVHGRLVQGGHC